MAIIGSKRHLSEDEIYAKNEKYKNKIMQRAKSLRVRGHLQPWPGPYRDASVETNISISHWELGLICVLVLFWSSAFLIAYLDPPESYKKYQENVTKETTPIRYDEFVKTNKVYAMLEKMVLLYPDFMALKSLPFITSYGREIKYVHINFEHHSSKKKKVVLIVANLNGVSWDSPLSVVEFLKRLLPACRNRETYMKDFEFYIIPNANPDTYEKSMKDQSKPFEFYNMKNMGKHETSNCSRTSVYNFGYHFGEHRDLSKFRPGSEDFVGTHAFSIAETKNVKSLIDIIEADGKKILLHIGLEQMINSLDFIFVNLQKHEKIEHNTKLLEHMVNKVAKKVNYETGALFQFASATSAPGGIMDYMSGYVRCPFVFSIDVRLLYRNNTYRLKPMFSIMKHVSAIFEILDVLQEYMYYRDNAKLFYSKAVSQL